MNHSQTLAAKKAKRNIDEIAKFETDLLDLKSDKIRTKFYHLGTKLINQNSSIIERHYGKSDARNQ